MVATTHPHHRLPILHGKGEIHVDLLRWMRVSLRYLGISPKATDANCFPADRGLKLRRKSLKTVAEFILDMIFMETMML